MSEQYLRMSASEIIIAKGDKRITLCTKEEFINLKHLCELALEQTRKNERTSWMTGNWK